MGHFLKRLKIPNGELERVLMSGANNVIQPTTTDVNSLDDFGRRIESVETDCDDLGRRVENLEDITDDIADRLHEING